MSILYGENLFTLSCVRVRLVDDTDDSTRPLSLTAFSLVKILRTGFTRRPNLYLHSAIPFLPEFSSLASLKITSQILVIEVCQLLMTLEAMMDHPLHRITLWVTLLPTSGSCPQSIESRREQMLEEVEEIVEDNKALFVRGRDAKMKAASAGGSRAVVEVIVD
jgi:hypothetical protein